MSLESSLGPLPLQPGNSLSATALSLAMGGNSYMLGLLWILISHSSPHNLQNIHELTLSPRKSLCPGLSPPLASALDQKSPREEMVGNSSSPRGDLPALGLQFAGSSYLAARSLYNSNSALAASKWIYVPQLDWEQQSTEFARKRLGS